MNRTQQLKHLYQINMENLYSYIFWYNTYTKIWYAIPTDLYTEFFSGTKSNKRILQSNKIDSLIELITKLN